MPCPPNRIHRDSRLISEILQNDNTHRLEWAYSRSRILPMTLNLDSEEQKTRTSSSSWHISESLRPRHCRCEKHKPVHKIWPSQVGLVRNRGCECLQTKRVKIGVILFSGYFFRFIFFIFRFFSDLFPRAPILRGPKTRTTRTSFCPPVCFAIAKQDFERVQARGKKTVPNEADRLEPLGFWKP